MRLNLMAFGSDRCDSCGFRDDAYVFLKIRAAFPGKAG